MFRKLVLNIKEHERERMFHLSHSTKKLKNLDLKLAN